jgi:hypothetical protein
MARFSFLHRIERQGADCVDAELIKIGVGRLVGFLYGRAHFLVTSILE